MTHHNELLALAGYAPDAWLAVARDVLAGGDVTRLAQLRAALAQELPSERARYTFSPCLRGHEEADRTVVGAIREQAGTQACWATMRAGTDRVYLVQAGDDADLPAVTVAGQQALSGSADPARVEVFSQDGVLTRYHEDALLAADLLWSRSPLPGISVARTFDGARPAGPWFDTQRELLADPAEQAALLEFLRAGELVMVAQNQLPDVITGQADVVPADLYSDGRWVWSAAAAYYLQRYHLTPDPELIAYAVANRSGGRLTPLARYHVRAALSPIGATS